MAGTTSSTPLIEAELLKEIASIVTRSDSSQSETQIENLQGLARRHGIHGTSRFAPTREILSLAGDKWTTLILEVLQTGTCRYSVLRQLVAALSHEGTISHRVLTTKLRLLERDGLIVRRVRASTPPRVDYQLSGLGQALIEKIESLLNWAEANASEIQEARDVFDAVSARPSVEC